MAPSTQTESKLSRALTQLKALSGADTDTLQRKGCDCGCNECQKNRKLYGKCSCAGCTESDRLAGQ
jgi:hypothetical protein